MPPSSDEPSPEPTDPVAADATLLSRAGIGVARLTANGEITAVNDAFADLTGYRREKLVGEPFAEFLVTLPPSLEALLDGGDPDVDAVTLTLPVAAGAGSVIGCESRFETVEHDGGSDRQIVAILYGDSERTEVRTSGPETNPDSEIAPARAFVALADALSEGIIVLDTESRIQYANPAVEQILGHTPDELVGGSKLSIIPERLRDTHLNALNRYLETGTKNIDWEYVELPGQHRDGHEVPLGISLNDFFFDGDRYFVGLFRDITARKEAEQALRERERQLEQHAAYTSDILDAIDDMFYVLDREGNLQRWNQTLREVTGYDDAEIESMHALEFFEEDARSAIADAISDGFETGHTRVETPLSTKDGETIPFEFVASALEDPDGTPVLAGIGRDITQREEQRRKLEASNERLEQFAYAASHDLQEPLRMITSYLELIERRYGDDLDSDGEEFLEYAVDGAERMREMIDGLLEYSRVDTQGDPLEPVDLDAIIADVRDDLQLKIEGSGAEITAEDLPTVSGDASQLRQVFQNLLENAIAYSGDEPPRIDVSAEQNGQKWRLAVSDEGVGIDPDEQDRVFEVFQRLHSRDEQAGSGLGLALCRRIVERHGGRIWVDSTPGEGSTFYFTLPEASKPAD